MYSPQRSCRLRLSTLRRPQVDSVAVVLRDAEDFVDGGGAAPGLLEAVGAQGLHSVGKRGPLEGCTGGAVHDELPDFVVHDHHLVDGGTAQIPGIAAGVASGASAEGRWGQRIVGGADLGQGFRLGGVLFRTVGADDAH